VSRRCFGIAVGVGEGILFGDTASSGGAPNYARSLRSLAGLLGRSLKSPTRTPSPPP